MNCESCRISISARLDGEDGTAPDEQVDAHLESCAACRAWQAKAAMLTRGLRVRPASPTPDLVDAVLAHAPRRRHRAVPRVALAVVAVAQLLLGALQMLGLGPHAHHGMSAHLFNESTAWNLAVGAGLLWAAARTRAVSGMLPLLSVFLVVLTGFSLHDLLAGVVSVDRVASHGLMLLGLGLLYTVHRTSSGGHPGGATAEDSDEQIGLSGHRTDVTGSTAASGRPPLRPTAQDRRAA
ncbi:zf-HC2 domain-containing protein [Saccharopolyspora erythraea]|uniref:zf-HC2 domain-containing protein n=1 Tax=Saccharopolyspora erythraea TaxID=1836 RepID=UPI001BADB1C9|nr:zf-HC2 domain-containing protein [Saccharopolyspora erythraea]QUH01650.1 zf-HC2 domain-containing protein [Saccharopolyspora erythraea]